MQLLKTFTCKQTIDIYPLGILNTDLEDMKMMTKVKCLLPFKMESLKHCAASAVRQKLGQPRCDFHPVISKDETGLNREPCSIGGETRELYTYIVFLAFSLHCCEYIFL